MGKPLVIVESPAKARTIEKFLGSDYIVKASVGHIRDLPDNADEVPEQFRGTPAGKLGVDVEHGFTPIYIIKPEKRGTVADLRAAMRGASAVYLATDEDREGEAISWHLREVLVPKVPVHRLVFHEITPEAIRHALATPRNIDENLVRAQEARRVIDRLYGYEVSPLLWKKVKPRLSAGRVQSPAVRLIVERERARMAFRSSGWWDLTATFSAKAGTLPGTLVALATGKLASGADFDPATGKLATKGAVVLDAAHAERLAKVLLGQTGRVESVESRPFRESPKPPFTTSTLQQEANRKLRWTAKDAMKSAQRLYESGWITYMRTDSVNLSEQALTAARDLIAADYGRDYLPSRPRVYTSTTKNAQEAHEAIRPAGTRFRSIEEARRELDPVDARLYELIWKRTVACQMMDAVGKRVAVDVLVPVPDNAKESPARFRSNGLTIDFPGFRRAYVEGSDDPEAQLADQERVLPAVVVGDSVKVEKLLPKGHTTQPPARLNDATLVKELESRGIGRPSTWASIIDTIIQRTYVFRKGNALVPTFTGFAVTALMEQHLGEFVDYELTARIEASLDEVSVGKRDRLKVLQAFYSGDKGIKARITGADAEIDPRVICGVTIGRVGEVDVMVRVGRFGSFLSAGDRTADMPDDMAPDEVTLEWATARLDKKAAGPRVLGKDENGVPVYVMDGRFGAYVQLGDAVLPAKAPVVSGKAKPAKSRAKAKATDEVAKPPRASLIAGMTPESVTLAEALGLLAFPRTLTGAGDAIQVFNGRYGPFVKRGTESRSIPAGSSSLAITYAEAEVLLATPATRRGQAAPRAPLMELGVTSKGAAVKVHEGKWGMYVTDGEANATLAKGTSLETLTLSEALELLEARRSMPTKPRRGGFRKAPSPGTKRVVGKRTAATAGPTAEKPAAKRAPPKATGKKPTTKADGAAVKKPAAKKPAAKKAGDDGPPAKEPALKKPAAKKPAVPVGDAPSAKKPAAKKPAPAKKSAARKPAAKKPSGESAELT